jgi:uncharacterized surface protein with fasciclin (FAS1) repeats
MTSMNRRDMFALGAGVIGAVAARQALAQTAITGTAPGATNPRNIADTLAADSRFSRFLELINRAGMVDNLRGAGPFTVFAPVNGAFTSAPSAQLQDLLGQGGGQSQGSSANPVRLPALVQYHIVNGIVAPADLAGYAGRDFRTMNGSPLRLASTGSGFTLSNPAPGTGAGFGAVGIAGMPPAAIMDTNGIAASNGIIYPINGVLIP